MTVRNDAVLTIVLGPTASGKEAAAFALALRQRAAIVSVDSMKIYCGLDIGTAKPDATKRAAVEHFCLDLADPAEDFSVARFQQAADAAIAQTAARAQPIILSGGTALYYKAILEGLFDAPQKDEALREELRNYAEANGNDALFARLRAADPAAAAKLHPNDVRRVVRALEIVELTGEPISARQKEWSGFHDPAQVAGFSGDLRYAFRMFRLDWPREELYRRIEARVDRMIAQGLEQEARIVYENRARYSRTPLQAVGYKEFFPYFAGQMTLPEAIDLLKKNTRHLAKSQTTWFRKFPAVAIPLAPGMTADNVADIIADTIQTDCER